MKKPSILSAFVVGLLFCLPLGCGSSKTSDNQSSNTGSGGGASVTPLAVTGVSPTTIVAGEQTTLIVTGTGFSTSSVVQVSGISLQTTFLSSTQLTATVAAGQLSASSSLSVSVVDKGLSAGSASVALEVDNPTPAISGLSPSSAVVSSGATTVTVTGSHFMSGITVQINGVARTTAYSSGSQLTVTLDPKDLVATGSLSVVALNPSPGGGTSNALAFGVLNPTPGPITVTPAVLDGGSQSNTTITINGSGFIATSTVQINGASRPTTYISPSTLQTVLTPADQANAGTLSVAVITPAPGGGSSTATSLVIRANPQPVLSSISPVSVEAGSAFTLHVFGTGFSSASTIYWNAQALSTQVLSSTEATAAISSNQTVTAGTPSITVQSPAPGGGQSSAVALSITSPVPVLSSASPSTIYRSSASTTLTLQGTGFQPTSTVLFNGSVLATTFIDSTKLSVTIAQASLPQTTSATLQVSTPAPGGGTSVTLPLTISNLIPPVITSVSASVTSTNTNCEQIILSITGTNLAVPSPLIKINGTAILPPNYFSSNTLSRVSLPTNFIAGANPQITIESQVITDLKSAPFTITSSAAAVCIQPYTPVVYPGTSFALDTYTSSIHPTTSPVISGLTVPTGFSVVSAAPYSPPTRIVLNVDANTAAGSYSITPQLQGAPAMTAALPVIVSATKPSLYFVSPQHNEIALPIGGSVSFNSQLITSYTSSGTSDLVVDLGLQGLPQGVSAKIQPSPSIAGDSVTITLTADKTAMPAQNVPINVVGTASGLGLSATSAYLLNIYKGPGTIPNNRTTFTPTRATPSAVVFDRAHNLVFASNAVWNRIDVISNQTHKIVRSIPVPSPAGIDLSQDNQTLWIATKSRQVYALDTTAFTMRQYTLSGNGTSQWASSQIFALANGDIFLMTDGSSGSNSALVWTPSTGAVNYISTFADSVIRSGDGTKVFGLITAFTNGCNVKVYSATQGMQTYSLDSGFTGSSVCGTLQASNNDGSMLVGDFAGASVKGVQFIDGTAHVLGSFSPALAHGYLSTQETTYFFPASFRFSADGTLLYQTGVLSNNRSLLATYDVATRTLLGLAPAITSSVPPMSSGYGGPSILADVDSTGMLIGIQSFGVAFEDATYFQNVGLTSQSLSAGTPSSFAPLAGPLSGGTTFGINAYTNLLPDVWFGDIRGTVSSSASSISLTSPATSDPGPVDLKLIYPNGMVGYTAQGFSYGPAVQNMVYSGASPSGGANATLTGFGLPADSSAGTVSIGGSTAAITSVVGQYPAWTGESVPSTYLKFTVPAGTPGYADVQVQTPNGSSTLPRAMFYASSVNSYAFDGTATAVIYDKSRNRAYIVTKSNVLVFDESAGSYLSPITPPTANNVLDLYDAALSVDGNFLIVTNRGDASVAVVDLAAGSSYVISTPYVAQPVNATCAIGPGPVAALAGNKALVLPIITNSNCYSAYYGAVIDLQGHTASSLSLGFSGIGWNVYRAQLQSNAAGSLALISMSGSASSYSPTSGFGAVQAPIGNTDAISGDGNIISGDLRFADSVGRLIGTVAQPPALYQGPLTGGYPAAASTTLLRGARFNAAGGLYFVPHAGYFEVIDTLSASLRMRFSLTQTVQDIPRPIAIDEGGRTVFLVTNEGLTVVDMGQAPLSIGHLGTASPVSGGTIQVRGSGFDANTTAMVDTTSVTASLVDENTINVTLPVLTSGPHDLSFKRNDGSSVTAQTSILIP